MITNTAGKEIGGPFNEMDEEGVANGAAQTDEEGAANGAAQTDEEGAANGAALDPASAETVVVSPTFGFVVVFLLLRRDVMFFSRKWEEWKKAQQQHLRSWKFSEMNFLQTFPFPGFSGLIKLFFRLFLTPKIL
jgi:hypothetical protein